MASYNRKKRRKREIILPLLTAALFCAATVWGFLSHIIRAPELDAPAYSQSADVSTQSSATAADPTPNLPQRRPYCYNILVSGLDDGNGGSDTNLFVQFDAQQKRVDVVSLPRDTLLNHSWASNKLNYAYAKGGTELLRSEISNLLGVPVDFHVTVSLQGFVTLVDRIGGVDFNVPVNMDYDDPTQDLHIHFEAGMQHLNGEDALRVVRWRKNNDGTGYASADIGRISTQQAFLTAVAKKLLSPENIADVDAFADIFHTYVKTDLTVGNLVWLGKETFSIGFDNISFHTLPGNGTAWYKGESVYALDPAATLAFVNETLNPYDEPLTAEQLDILVP